jgi:peptide/nickel transport system substrate-binding protein
VTRARVGVAAIAVALAACGQSTTSNVRNDATSASSHAAPVLVAENGGSATVALDEVPVTLNDHTVAGDNSPTRAVASAIWPQIFQPGPQQAPVLDTSVVQSAELVSVAPQTVQYQISPLATWSDGVPISVDDFVYAWHSQRGGAADVDGSPDSVASTLGYRDIVSVTGSNGGRTVTVVFRTPFGDWASLFDDLLPAHVAERVGWNHGFDSFSPAVTVSGGPWQVQSWQPGVEITLVRNPHWWGKPPRTERMVIEAHPNPADLERVMQDGQAQVAYPSNFGASELASMSSGQTLETSESLGTTMLQIEFNTRRVPLDLAAVREGIGHLVDRAGLVTDFVQPLDPSVWEDNSFLFANTDPQYTDDAGDFVQPDPATATRLLNQAGLSQDANGTWTSHGSPVVLQFVWASDDPWSAMVAPEIAAQLTAAGFDVSSVPVTSTELQGFVLPVGAFDLALAPISASTYPSEMARYFTTAADLTSPGVSTDWSGFADPALDTLLSRASQELGSNVADPIYRQADLELWSEMPTMPLFAEPTLLVTSTSIDAVQDDPGGLGPMYFADSWYRLVAIRTRSGG